MTRFAGMPIPIDKRPLFQPDERDEVIQYTEASTERIMQFLRKVDPAADGKVKYSKPMRADRPCEDFGDANLVLSTASIRTPP